jgi:hypothetical protein
MLTHTNKLKNSYILNVDIFSTQRLGMYYFPTFLCSVLVLLGYSKKLLKLMLYIITISYYVDMVGFSSYWTLFSEFPIQKVGGDHSI